MEFRKATRSDLPAIVAMLADDELGATRERYEDPLPREYLDAFEAMGRREGNDIILAVDDGVVVGCLQLTLISGLSRLGMTRAQIEGVRVNRRHRGKGIGEKLVNHAVALARRNGCGLVQLTTDNARPDTHRFYEALGFVPSHVGMKLNLSG